MDLPRSWLRGPGTPDMPRPGPAAAGIGASGGAGPGVTGRGNRGQRGQGGRPYPASPLFWRPRLDRRCAICAAPNVGATAGRATQAVEAHLGEALVGKGFCRVDISLLSSTHETRTLKAAVRRIDAGQVGGITSGASWTPL